MISALFFHWFERSRENGPVADRATKRVAAREGTRGPAATEPVPGVDVDVDEVIDGTRSAGAPDGDARAEIAEAIDPTDVPPRPEATAPVERRATRGRACRRRGAAQAPEMTRERARSERRDLDKERGEPVAGPRGTAAARSSASAGPLGDWTTRPRILVTNDDGIESRGLLALKLALDPIGDVTVVAPDLNQSAVGHPKTLMRPLRVRERTLADGSTGYSVDGSPTDCVSLAFLGFFEERFDLVASGINYGANLGDDITYSGHRVGGDGGGHQQLPGLRDQPGVRRARRLRAGGQGGRGHGAQHPGARPASAASCCRSTCRPCPSRSAAASRSRASASGSTRTS